MAAVTVKTEVDQEKSWRSGLMKKNIVIVVERVQKDIRRKVETQESRQEDKTEINCDGNATIFSPFSLVGSATDWDKRKT